MRVVKGGKLATEDGTKRDLDPMQASARSAARRSGTDFSVRIQRDVKSAASMSRVTLEIRDAHAHRRLALPSTAEGVRHISRPTAATSLSFISNSTSSTSNTSNRYSAAREGTRSPSTALSARRTTSTKPSVYNKGRQQRNSVESSESSESNSSSPRIFFARGRCVSAISHVNTTDWLQVGADERSGDRCDRNSGMSARRLPHVDRYNRPAYWNSMEPSFYMSTMGRRSQRCKSVASMLVDLHGARREDYQWARSRSHATYAWHGTSKTRSSTRSDTCAHTRKGVKSGAAEKQAEVEEYTTVLVPSAREEETLRRPSSGVRTAFNTIPTRGRDVTGDRYMTYNHVVDVQLTEGDKSNDYWMVGEVSVTHGKTSTADGRATAGNDEVTVGSDRLIIMTSSMTQYTSHTEHDESLQLDYNDFLHLNTADDDNEGGVNKSHVDQLGDKSAVDLSDSSEVTNTGDCAGDVAARRQANGATSRHPSHIKLKRAQSARNVLHTHHEVEEDEEEESDNSGQEQEEQLTGDRMGPTFKRPTTATAGARHMLLARHSQNDLTFLATIDLRGKTARDALDIPRLCLDSPPPPPDLPDNWQQQQQQQQSLQLVVPQLHADTTPATTGSFSSTVISDDAGQLSQDVTSLQLNMRNTKGGGGRGGEARLNRSDSAQLLVPKLRLGDDSPSRLSPAENADVRRCDDVSDNSGDLGSLVVPSWRLGSPPPPSGPMPDGGDTHELDSVTPASDKPLLHIPTIQLTPD